VDGGLATVFAAVVAALGLILQQVMSSRKEQKQDHGIVQTKLDNLVGSVERVETKVDGHITDHARGVM
jgi:hypothetical protein